VEAAAAEFFVRLAYVVRLNNGVDARGDRAIGEHAQPWPGPCGDDNGFVSVAILEAVIRRSVNHCRSGTYEISATQGLATQRALEQFSCTCRSRQTSALCAVDTQYLVDGVRWNVLPKFGANSPVALPGALRASGGVVPGQQGERYWIPAQYVILPVLPRHDLEQPPDGSVLKAFAAGRVYADRPSCGH
jgi:hypothetical protein